MCFKKELFTMLLVLGLAVTPCFAGELIYEDTRVIPIDKIEVIDYEKGTLNKEDSQAIEFGKVSLIKADDFDKNNTFNFSVDFEGYHSIYTNGYSDTQLEIKLDAGTIYSDEGGHGQNACFTIYLEKGKVYTLDVQSNGFYSLFIQKGLPLSGSEVVENLEVFNAENVIDNTNCYTYALNLTKNPFTNRSFRINGQNPGELAGQSIGISDLYSVHNARKVVESACLLDSSILKNGFEKIGAFEMPDKGYYKIALLIDEGYDIHWLRQNSDGSWSHKQGISLAKDYDSDFEKIFIPHQSNISTYDKLIGYYQVKAIY